MYGAIEPRLGYVVPNRSKKPRTMACIQCIHPTARIIDVLIQRGVEKAEKGRRRVEDFPGVGREDDERTGDLSQHELAELFRRERVIDGPR